MPFDTKSLSVLEAEQLMANAPWIERYLIGKAYGAFALKNVSPSYDVLDKNTASSGMKDIVANLNSELKELGYHPGIRPTLSMSELVNDLRRLLKSKPDRTNCLDWLVGNSNETFWDEAQKNLAHKMTDDELLAFCAKLSAEAKAKKASQNK